MDMQLHIRGLLDWLFITQIQLSQLLRINAFGHERQQPLLCVWLITLIYLEATNQVRLLQVTRTKGQ